MSWFVPTSAVHAYAEAEMNEEQRARPTPSKEKSIRTSSYRTPYHIKVKINEG